MANIKNIPLRKFRKWLELHHCTHIRNKGGHEMWSRKDLHRSLTIQSHIDPIPARIIRQILGYLEVTVDDFLKQIEEL